MTLHPVNQWEIPAQTAKIARASFPKGNMYMKMYDELGVLYADREFAALFPTTYGKSAMSPGKLALITLMQFAEGLSDCPQGNFNRLWRTARDSHHNPLIEIVFDRQTCAACPVRNLCTSSATAARKIKLRPRDEYEALMERRHQQQTLQFQQNYAHRAGVEGTISQGVGRFDLRRTRYFGLAKTHLQHIATACAINLSRFFDWSNHATKARTRTSSFARLRVHCA